MLSRIELRNFRSHQNFSLNIEQPLLIIHGPNASGKTNILEAIYVSTISKSFRVADKYLPNTSSDFFSIQADFQNIKPEKVEIQYHERKSPKKRYLRSGVKYPNYTLIGRNPIVLFEPNHSNLLVGSPSLRRAYLDSILSQVDKHYLQSLQAYRRLLRQRNSLLLQNKRSGVSNLKQQLFVYNIQMSEPASYISNARVELLHRILKPIQQTYQTISNSKLDISLRLHPFLEEQADYITKAEQSYQADIASARTNYGPQREDFTLLLNNSDVHLRASRGELRSLILALKIAEINYIKDHLKKDPILLFDDVLSELDEQRQIHLLDIAKDYQTIITCTELPDITKSIPFQGVKL